MSDRFVLEPRPCDGCENPAAYVSDNNGRGVDLLYCERCEEFRSDRYGCALIVSQGAMCQDGACGCGGTGVYKEVVV